MKMYYLSSKFTFVTLLLVTLSFSTPQEDLSETGLQYVQAPEEIRTRLEGNEIFTRFYTNIQTKDMLTLAQMFISITKAYWGTTELILSGKDVSSKPEWSFYPYYLTKLVVVELRLYYELKNFYQWRNPTNPPTLLVFNYLDDIDKSTMKVFRNPELFQDKMTDPYLYISSHPLLAYRMIRRFAADVQHILAQIKVFQPDLLTKLLAEVNPEGLVFPIHTDILDSLDSLKRLQKASLVPTQNLAKGIFEGVNTNIHLNAMHAFEIGCFYATESDWDLSIEWIHLALSILRREPNIYFVEIEYIEKVFEAVTYQHNGLFRNHYDDPWHPNVFNTVVHIPFHPEKYKRRVFDFHEQATRQRNVTEWNWSIMKNFARVCAGENLQTPEEKLQLQCWLERTSNPYWLINPLKVELLHETPQVLQIYDFIPEKIASQMKNYALNHGVSRSTVANLQEIKGFKVDRTRTSVQTWIYENLLSGYFLKAFAKKVELLTGLILRPPSTNDAFQVAAYGPAQQYEPHWDAFDSLERIQLYGGNRLATFMGYLSDVTVGGRTGFPVLGFSAEPVKGSVLLWYNLDRDSLELDTRTWHGGCPVSLGIKWITNKWINSFDNMFHYGCLPFEECY